MKSHVSEPVINPNNRDQIGEIRDIAWFKYEDAYNKIRDNNLDRKAVLKQVHRFLIKNYYT